MTITFIKCLFFYLFKIAIACGHGLAFFEKCPWLTTNRFEWRIEKLGL
jgi:hypothetical protein